MKTKILIYFLYYKHNIIKIKLDKATKKHF